MIWKGYVKFEKYYGKSLKREKDGLCIEIIDLVYLTQEDVNGFVRVSLDSCSNSFEWAFEGDNESCERTWKRQYGSFAFWLGIVWEEL